MAFNLSIWIRTHSSRLYLAESLMATCRDQFKIDPLILNTGEPSIYFTQKFMIALLKAVHTCDSDYILILEDDIALNANAQSAVQESMKRNDTHNWFSVDLSTDILEKSICAPNYGYILQNAKHIHYSGAVLLQREDLKSYLEWYTLNHLDLEFQNFDVTLSSFIIQKYGMLHLRPGYFEHREGVKSSIQHFIQGRSEVNLNGLKYKGVSV